MNFIWLLAGSMRVLLARFRCASPGGFEMNVGNTIRQGRFGPILGFYAFIGAFYAAPGRQAARPHKTGTATGGT
jgi:hypothetical protein